MPVTELIREGVQLMFIGMGSVFVFLSILVLSMKAMSALAMRLEPEQQVLNKGSGGANNAPFSEKQEIIAVITAAISRYRSTH